MSALHVIYSREKDIKKPLITILPTVPPHLRELAAVLRPEDEREILAFGITPEKALWRSYKASLWAKTVYIDGQIAAIYGIGGTLLGDPARPWLLTSEQVKKISPLKFARHYQAEVKEMLKIYSKLSSIVDADYSAAIRLLEIIGFEVSAPEKMGNQGRMFRRFEKAI